jgi:hypothetical protein
MVDKVIYFIELLPWRMEQIIDFCIESVDSLCFSVEEYLISLFTH